MKVPLLASRCGTGATGSSPASSGYPKMNSPVASGTQAPSLVSLPWPGWLWRSGPSKSGLPKPSVYPKCSLLVALPSMKTALASCACCRRAPPVCCRMRSICAQRSSSAAGVRALTPSQTCTTSLRQPLVREPDVDGGLRLAVIPALAGGDVRDDLANEIPPRLGTLQFQQQIAGEREVVAAQHESLYIGDVQISHLGALRLHRPAG